MREVARRKAALRKLVDRVVRGYAVAALLSCGFSGAAEALEELEPLEEEHHLGPARDAVFQATTAVLREARCDRALLALVAASEAIAMAAAPEPGESHLQEALEAAAVAAAAAGARSEDHKEVA
jgi:hypothetical protein